MKEHNILVQQISIDGDPEARSQVMTINNGYASVPTLIFPDGTTLTEPSFRQLRTKLGLEQTSLVNKVRKLFGG
jgi:mycoredoxin